VYRALDSGVLVPYDEARFHFIQAILPDHLAEPYDLLLVTAFMPQDSDERELAVID
jgi:hypothetical protein